MASSQGHETAGKEDPLDFELPYLAAAIRQGRDEISIAGRRVMGDAKQDCEMTEDARGCGGPLLATEPNDAQPSGIPATDPGILSLPQQSAVSFGPSRPSPNRTMPLKLGSMPWRSWPELTIRLKNIPRDAKPLDLFRNLRQHGGEITFIEVFDENYGSSKVGRVRFSPPPQTAFWGKSPIPFKSSGRSYHVRVEVEPLRQMTAFKVRSPTRPRVFYDRCIKLAPSCMSFGVMQDDITLMPLKTLQGSKDVAGGGVPEFEITLDLVRMELAASFRTDSSPNRPGFYKFSTEFRHLDKVHWNRIDGSQSWALVIPLKHPPHYFWKRESVEQTFADNSPTWTRSLIWHRATNIETVLDGQMFRQLSLQDSAELTDPSFVNLGRWTAFGFIFHEVGRASQALDVLQNFNVTIDAATKLKVAEPSLPPLWNLIHAEPATQLGMVKRFPHVANLCRVSGLLDALPFDIRYQLEVCISRGALSEYAIDAAFLLKLESTNRSESRRILERVADEGKRVTDPMTIFGKIGAASFEISAPPSLRSPSYCVVMRKVMVTPTTLYLTSPTLEVANRVLRRFQHLQDRFIRVQFTGELYDGRIRPRADSERDDHIYKRVYRVLFRGIRVGGRHYEFLAFGNSQIRENGAYFFSPTNQISCDDIRNSMGKFSHIRTVAKFAARMGQCFSSTREIRTISVPKIRPIEDVENAAGYCFTDGVGKISAFLAAMIVQELDLDFAHMAPSAYQFRMGGCKGVLAVWPDAKKREVHVRRSQAKFESEYNGLEIIRCARFASATLNRQIITILSSLGVQTQTFLDLLNVHVEKHNSAQIYSRDAISLLRQQVDENQTTLTLAEIVLHGFREPAVKEPFISTVLNLWRVWSLKLVKEKARIPIDRSAFVLGCVDETATLRGHQKSTEGASTKDVGMLPQIFLQITDAEEPAKAKVITGVCLVGRNPSLHPGDIRVVEAVDILALRHLRDVVVFPQKGDRDLPSMLSGGDLDGDDFFVIWEPTLIPPEWNHPPMDYQPPKPKEIDTDVQVCHLQKFFVSYMKNDILPTVALAHLAHADNLHDGAKNPKCITLAKLHSKAVDYVKSGEPAEMDKSLIPRRWPHFMEKRVPRDMVYRSKRALGAIYDTICDVAFIPSYTHNFDKRILDKAPQDAELLEKARQIKAQYDVSMRRILSQREIATEFEVWSGFVLSKPRVGSAYKVQEEIGRQFGSVRQKFRELCYEAAGYSSGDGLKAFVAAMYKVTSDEAKSALEGSRGDPTRRTMADASRGKGVDAESMPLISFPWIFHEVLCKLATGRSAMKEVERPVEDRRGEGSTTSTATPIHPDEVLATEATSRLSIHHDESLGFYKFETESTRDGPPSGYMAGSSRASEFAEDNEDSEDDKDDKDKEDSEDNDATSGDGTGDAITLLTQPLGNRVRSNEEQTKSPDSKLKSSEHAPQEEEEEENLSVVEGGLIDLTYKPNEDAPVAWGEATAALRNAFWCGDDLVQALLGGQDLAKGRMTSPSDDIIKSGEGLRVKGKDEGRHRHGQAQAPLPVESSCQPGKIDSERSLFGDVIEVKLPRTIFRKRKVRTTPAELSLFEGCIQINLPKASCYGKETG